MNVFISWSGKLSLHVAKVLKEWLPSVLQAVKPWMSTEDIEKGSRWGSEMATELYETKAGISCVTPDNQEAPWLNFEAGALWKAVDRSFVCPFLFRMRQSELKWPLAQFQATDASSKDDVRRLIGTLNKALKENALAEKQLDKTFETWWPELKTSLEKIPSLETEKRPKRTDRDLLEEMLALVREQDKREPLKINVTDVIGAGEVVTIDPGELWDLSGLPSTSPSRRLQLRRGRLRFIEPSGGETTSSTKDQPSQAEKKDD